MQDRLCSKLRQARVQPSTRQARITAKPMLAALAMLLALPLAIIEVDTRDRPGLLYDLTRTLAANNIYIASAVIATYGAQVFDSFYVKDMFGLKLHAKSKRDSLERKLRQAITEGAERARAE